MGGCTCAAGGPALACRLRDILTYDCDTLDSAINYSVVAVSTSTVLALLLSLDPGTSRASHAFGFALGSNAFFWAYQVGPGSDARHVIDTHLNPRFLNEVGSYDVASNMCQALLPGGALLGAERPGGRGLHGHLHRVERPRGARLLPAALARLPNSLPPAAL